MCQPVVGANECSCPMCASVTHQIPLVLPICAYLCLLTLTQYMDMEFVTGAWVLSML